jgi:hypothetical protein
LARRQHGGTGQYARAGHQHPRQSAADTADFGTAVFGATDFGTTDFGTTDFSTIDISTGRWGRRIGRKFQLRFSRHHRDRHNRSGRE